MPPVQPGDVLTTQRVNRFTYILGATFLLVVALGVWLLVLSFKYTNTVYDLNATKTSLREQTKKLAQVDDARKISTAGLQQEIDELDHELEVTNGQLEIVDSAVLGSQKRKVRIQTTIAAIKATLPAGGNPIKGCKKAPSPGELWSIAGAIVDNADHYAVPESLIAAVIRQESAFCNTAVSAAGAKGYMQLMPDTAAQVSSDVSIKTGRALRTWRGKDNIQLGTAYLSEQLMEFDGDAALAAAAYNAGPNHVKKVRAGITSRFHEETADYMVRVPEWQRRFRALGLQ